VASKRNELSNVWSGWIIRGILKGRNVTTEALYNEPEGLYGVHIRIHAIEVGLKVGGGEGG